MAGHYRRAGYRQWRLSRNRKTLKRRGERRWNEGNFRAAWVHFEWMFVADPERLAARMEHDYYETEARVLAAIVQYQLGERTEADAAWNAARDANYVAAMWTRAKVAADGLPLPEGLPGNEPSDYDGIMRAMEEHLRPFSPGAVPPGR
jgi:hypothetical protein